MTALNSWPVTTVPTPMRHPTTAAKDADQGSAHNLGGRRRLRHRVGCGGSAPGLVDLAGLAPLARLAVLRRLDLGQLLGHHPEQIDLLAVRHEGALEAGDDDVLDAV